MVRDGIVAIVAALALSLVACAARKPEPIIAGSASSPNYAQSFPQRLASVKKDFGAQEAQALELSKRFSEFPEALDEPSWDRVLRVYELADQEGRSEAYVERFERVAVVATFFVDKRDPIRQRVAGAVQHAAKEKNCSEELGGSAVYALDRVVEERLAEQLHQVSDAHAVIDRYEEEIGQKNVKKLGDQADQVSRASYLAYVGIIRTTIRLRQMIDELSDVRKTLQRTSADLEAEAQEPGLDPKRRAELDERRNDIQKAQADLDAELATAQSLSEAADRHVEQVQKEYTAAFESLMERARAKRDEQTTPAS